MKSKRFKMPGREWKVFEEDSTTFAVRATVPNVRGDVDRAIFCQRLDNRWALRADCAMKKTQMIAFLEKAIEKVRAAK